MGRWRLYLRVLAVGLFGLQGVIHAQSVVVSGSQSAATARFQILDQRVVSFGQHSITFNRVAPPVFSAAAPTPTPAPPQQQYADYLNLTVFATVYDGRYTIAQWFNGDQNLVVASNVNFDYVTDLYGFAEGDTFYGLVAFVGDESSSDADPTTAAWLAQARAALPAGGTPGYLVLSGTECADVVQSLDALHSYYGANKDVLVQQYLQRKAAYAAQLLELKLHPPARPNTVINYWPIKSSVYPTGSNQ